MCVEAVEREGGGEEKEMDGERMCAWKQYLGGCDYICL